MNAKDVTKHMCPPDTPTDTNSAPPVHQRFFLDLGAGDLKLNNIKCGPCKAVTPHQWLMAHVVDSEGITDPVELADLHKRLILCQNCGNIRLVK